MNYRKLRFIINENKVLSKNISGTMLLKIVSITVGFLSMPAYLAFFSEQAVLGVWFTLLSILNWILTFDLGIGNGLRNNLVRPLVRNDYIEIKKQISSAYIILGLISFFTLIVGWFSINYLNWNSLLNIQTDVLSNEVLVKTILIVFTCIILQFWLRIITSIFKAMQKIVLANALGVITSILIFTFLLFGKTDNLTENLLNLAYVHFIAAILPLVAATFYAFKNFLKEAIPSIHFYDKRAAKKIVSLGGAFFVIQIGLLVVHSTNQILIASLFNAEDVVNYQLYYKFFSIATMIFVMFTQPIWSATSNAYERRNFNWIKKAYKFLNLIALVGTIGCFVIITQMQFIFNIWLGENTIVILTSTALLFATFAACELFMYSATCIANGIGKLKCQLVCIIIAAFLKIPIAFLLSLFLNSWESVVIAHILVLLPLIIFQPISLRKYLKDDGELKVQNIAVNNGK